MSPNRRRSGLALLTILALAATAACGSTVQQAGGNALKPGGVAGAPELGGDGLTTPGTPGSGPTTGTSTDVLAGPGGAVAPGSTSGSTGGGTTPPSGGAGAPQAPVGGGAPQAPGAAGGAQGPGVTAETVAIGVTWCSDCASTNAAVGAGGEDPGDTRRYMRAAIEEVNARGGVLGRKLVPVFHEIRASDPVDVSAQAACETFTKDNKVLVMYFRGELFYDCARKAGILAGGLEGAIGPTYDSYPNLFAPGFVRLERLYAVTVRAMVQAGWQKPEPAWPTGKIGLITWQDNVYKFAMDKGYLAAMKQAGLEAKDVRYVAVPQGANAIADASAAISNAVLSFRQQGIDHVLIGDGPAGIFGGCGLTFLFLSNAQSQSYFPRYGFNSNNCPDFANHPKGQLVGMLAIDSSDGDPKNDQGIARNPVRDRCFATMSKRGLPVGQDQTRNIAVIACEYAYFTEALLKRTNGSTTLPAMIAAGESLGTSYRSPMSYGNRIGRGQRDGAALFRALRWDEGCQCNQYTSQPFAP